MVVGRLAPSPTGAQHLGNARTYLLAWLAARAHHGRVILRIEDIDSPRVKPWATQQAIDDLRWLGLDWEEGPDVGGQSAPYIQTERKEIYRSSLKKLLSGNHVYPCSCTRTDIEQAASAPHEGMDGVVYPGTCARWQPGDAIPEEGGYCWRFRCRDHDVRFTDLLLGQRTMNPARDMGDFPVTRKGGDAAYHLAVVVDDAAMGVDQVVRGEDLLPSAVRQRELMDVLGLPIPAYSHVPLVVGPDGRRLAKRHGDTRLSQYRDSGVSAESIVGWAAHSAGLIPDARPVTPLELIPLFDWTRIPRGPTVVGEDCLDQPHRPSDG